jgi:hypothetical protein
MKPLSRLLFIPLLAIIAAGVIGAKCYPPGSRVIIFMQGIYTALDENGTIDVGWEDHAYDKLKASFVTAGYKDEQLLDFSYAGGTVDDAGAWHPDPYECEITDRYAAVNLAVLETMLRDLRAKRPEAHFTLVGHSLGGYLAYLEGVRESQRPDADKLHVDVIVALDAPLRGVNADKKLVLDLAIGCPKTYQAGGEIVSDGANPEIRNIRAAEVEAMRAAGIRVATLGSNADCLFNTPRCVSLPLVDDTQTQYIDNADLVKRWEIQSKNIFLSHFAIFAYPQMLIDVVAFVGAP